VSSYVRDVAKENPPEIAELIDDRTARVTCNPDWCYLRRTPPGQKTVGELVFKGDTVTTSYGRDRLYSVLSVSEHEYYGLKAWSLVLSDGSYSNAYINELVAQDNRLLKLFVANTDETFVGAPKGQTGLFRFNGGM